MKHAQEQMRYLIKSIYAHLLNETKRKRELVSIIREHREKRVHTKRYLMKHYCIRKLKCCQIHVCTFSTVSLKYILMVGFRFGSSLFKYVWTYGLIY